MPNENKKRGRWADKKRKRNDFEDAQISVSEHDSAEQQQPNDYGDVEVRGDAGDDFISFGQMASHDRPNQDDRPFYGLLNPQEQEYYTNVNVKLELNDFESAEDKAIFLDAVYRESQGKELKIASSQSCSRYLERLIRVSNVEQMRSLFGKFVGHFLQLVQHRFASHCCEALFLKAAEAVGDDDRSAEQDINTPSVEQLFLTVVDELEPNLGYLLADRFASHVVRLLLLVLCGEPLNSNSNTSVLSSRKKEKIEPYESRKETHETGSRRVPDSFKKAFRRMVSSSVSSLDTTYIRALATHPTGNPILQLLLRLELLQDGKSKAKDADSVMHKLLPDESLEEGTEGAKFIQGLLYDPTGSRLVETIIQHAPGKMFKKLYGNLLKHRIGPMAKNDIASYVAIRIMERLSREDLQGVRDEILPEIATLVTRNRLGIIRVLVERCDIRRVDLLPVVSALRLAYGEDPTTLLLKMLNFEPAKVAARAMNDKQEIENDKPAGDIHGSLLAQSLLQCSATFGVIHQCLQALSKDTILQLAKEPSASRVIQNALNTPSSSPQSNRKLIPKFYGHMAELAIDVSGSHLADALWPATNGLHFMKERFARELQTSESILRDSRYGRNVWKNWSMNVYQRRPMEWQALAKGVVEQVSEDVPKMSALEAARERFASQQGKGRRPTYRSKIVSANA
jgi:nucleolar protein 9